MYYITTMDTDSIYETVTLPNGGLVQLDKLAFEAFQGQCRSTRKQNGKHVWSATLYFDDNTIETAVVKQNNVMFRSSHDINTNIELR